jgi:hypothetical protein
VQDQTAGASIDSSAIEVALKDIAVNTLIDEAKLYWNNPKRAAEAEQWDLIFTSIGNKLARSNAGSLKPLLVLFEERGPAAFIALCDACRTHNIVGPHLAWTYEWCKEDLDLFVKSITDRDPTLIEHLNKKAQFYNCFVDHEPVPLLQVETERSSEHVTQREHVTLPNKEVVSAVVLATAKSPVADRRLWIDFAVIFVIGLVIVQLIA